MLTLHRTSQNSKRANFFNNLAETDDNRIDYVNIVTNPGAALTVNRSIKVVIMTTLMTEVVVDRTVFTDGVYTDRTLLVN